MKVVHIIESLDRGGAEKALLDLIMFRPKKNIQHIIITLTSPGPLLEIFESNNIRVYSLKKKKGIDLKIIFRLRKLVFELDPDLIHTHLFTGNLWGRLSFLFSSIPIVMSVQNLDTWISGIRKVAEKMLANRPEKIVCVSKSAYDHRLSLGSQDDRLIIINNGSSRKVESSLREDVRRQWGVESRSIVVGFVGRCVQQKNPQLFLSIAERLKKQSGKYYFIWVGEGDLREKMMLQAKNLNINNVIFIAHSDQPMEILSGFDIYLSTALREGFSLSMVDAMRTGVPIVATKVPGNCDILKDIGKDYLFECEQVEKAVDLINLLSEDAERKKAYQKKLKEHAFSFLTSERMALEYQRVYEDVLN